MTPLITSGVFLCPTTMKTEGSARLKKMI